MTLKQDSQTFLSRPGTIIWPLLLVLACLLAPGMTLAEGGRLGAFFTEAERAIWLSRSTAGPYRTPGDVSAFSPGDWTRIQTNADAFLAQPQADRVQGITTERCLTYDDYGTSKGMPGHPATQDAAHGWRILNAAFVYAVTGNAAYGTPVIAELVAQAGSPGTDHRNALRFCPDNSDQAGSMIAWPLWLAKMALAYDYAKAAASPASRTTIETWLHAAATYWEDVGARHTRNRFPQRDTYTQDAQYVIPPVTGEQGTQHRLYHGGPVISGFHTAWSNTKLAAMSSVAILAVITGNTAIQASAKRFVKEALMFATWPTGGMDDLQRNFGGTHGCTGLDYTGDQLGSMVLIADVLARNGDHELYTYSTTHGAYGTEGVDQRSGTPKSLRNSLVWWYTYADGTLRRYAEGHPGDETFTIDTTCGQKSYVTDLKFAPLANLYYQDAGLRAHYLRTAAGMPPYPAAPEGGETSWGHRHGLLPGVLFQFGQLEGVVNPYTPTPPVSVTPVACTTAGSVLSPALVVEASPPSAGRPVSALFTSVVPEAEEESYVTTTSPAIVTFDLGRAVALSCWSFRGDNDGTIQCGTLTIEHSDNATDWTLFAPPLSCHADRSTLLAVAPPPQAKRYWRATITEHAEQTGTQMFFLGATPVQEGTR